MIASDVMDRVKRIFGDESGVQVTDTDLIRWINDGQREIVKHNETLFEKTAFANVVEDQIEYSLPVDLAIFQGLSLKYTGWNAYQRVKGYSFRQFNEFVDNWDGTEYPASVPSVFTVYAGKVIIFPRPDVDITNGLKIYYNRKPTDVASSASTLDVPDQYFEVIVKYCLSQAYEMDEDWEAAQNKGNEMGSDIQVLRGRETWKDEESYPVITVRLEDID